MNSFYPKIVEILRAHHFQLKRQGKGSHEMWGNGRVSVTVATTCTSRHTANIIMKQAGIAHRF